jgi:hypothetical protein
LNEWVKKPNEKDFSGDQWKENQAWEAYQKALATCTPIVSEDTEKVTNRIAWNETYKKNIPLTDKIRTFENIWQLVDGTLYKDTGIELEPVDQIKYRLGNAPWIKMKSGTETLINDKIYEYRRAFKLKV